MDSPCSVNRRQAWAQSSRQWLTVEDTELHASASSNTNIIPAAQLSLQDEVFPDGCSTGKIETWLQSCGKLASQENSSQLTLESFLRSASSFEDDLSLGAEAIGLDGGLHDEEFGHCPLLLPPPKSRRKDLLTSSTPQQRLNVPFRSMGHSMASSIYSSTTNKTASSVSEVLQMCAEDAEETLYQLGFGCEEPQVTARIPARFFTFPSQLRGINFRLFLESQLRRIREEDPSLSLASRFRQVEVLTAMANAFYSLYSHVSRTPLQKLAPPEFSFSSPTVERSIGQRFFGNVRTEPRSPVERLKDTVSKMCLYTRGSDPTSPNCSPRKRNSLPDVVEMVVGNVRPEGTHDQSRGMLIQGGNITHKVKDEKAVQHAEKMSDPEKTSSAHKQRIQRWSQSGQREGPRAKSSLFKLDQASLESRHTQNSQDTDLDEDSSNSTLLPDSSKYPDDTNAPTPIITFHTVSTHVVEHVHKAPYGCPETYSVSAMGLSTPGTIHRPESCSRTTEHKPSITDTESSPVQYKDELMVEVPVTSKISQGDPVSLHPSITQGSPCQIMVTGWEDDGSVLHRNSFEGYTHFTYPGSTAQMHSSQSEQQKFLSPSNPSTSQINCHLKPANSFELEEVQSVGEEENISVEQSSACMLSVTASTHQKGSPTRGDSFQSDSSGFAEEDMQNLLTSGNKEIS
ncbi:protein ITPRID2 isoform X1 [Hemibagrus wyckioides]|uniref:protein ITPRID2 isoform X1 n=1 Tax=Hemibagrus wyckioides TaxID=337641 RepID=UPI00266D3629|nr:protein ITPRID2 isoform X1 [Hemibagrus wyckioides]